MLKSLVSKILGSRNNKLIKLYTKEVQKINALESSYASLSDTELQNAFNELKILVQNGEASLQDVLHKSFAITREASKRTLGMRHFDVQLIGGMTLNDGRIAEMKTGEGKTLVATLAVCLNALCGRGVHIVTVNDYLANRDAKELEPLYNFLGFSVGIITNDLRDDNARLEAYRADIVYGTNNEFGFDYLRDNMKYDLSQKVQREHYFAIIDEVDSILIDEARTPLIISGPVNRTLEHYQIANSVAQKLKNEIDFTIDEKNRVILLTEEGIKNAESLFKVDNLYSIENATLSHHLDQALKANYLFIKDKDYVVQDNEVVIVDEFTGRLSEGRRFSEGLHQAIEAKEKVDIKEESQTLADITFQNYFRLYERLSGMTGTAQTEATEFLQIYNLEVVSIPTNVPVQRKDLNDLIYKSEREKFNAVINKITELHKKGQPVLVGTASIEKSEILHELLKKCRIPHTILNAKQHSKEAEIIKDAGVKGAVTIATNMAGRGVDIKITDEIRELGGLYIIGTERHESRRIDNQLRGRAGRQGDPGVSQFYLSLEDSLLRIFGSDKIKGIMERLGLKEGEHIESGLVTRSVESAQKKVENLHFESRKHLLEYDDVANEQRKAVYKLRNELLSEDFSLEERIKTNREITAQSLLYKAQILPGDDASNFDLSSLQAQLSEELGFKLESCENLSYDELLEKLITQMSQSYEEKMSKLESSQRSQIERIIYLQVLDSSWREHLYTMDNLKTGIGLRGYNQKDPLVEYKKESYNLFLEFIENLKTETTRMLHIIQLREQEEEVADKMLQDMQEELNEDLQTFEAQDSSSKPQKAKISRNDPCPCGSGKKYKLCHGKSGPKKGLLA
ncbi:preprotein translocase subunit SecA [Helicobacter cinaedi PAGU611]|uniref:Protein translocase subunit SecA n=1 Tax=Helicobacter cinaedi CCUG 18818 = ATCC BAA-847 TaxID=537971 RepID=A0AAI8MM41_9HELI|nr:preprotein translocase subunit SecA [Helicobacter cinaedi]AWK61373.1 preprotein translocase subunit SecA [Helicobacter cinaedi]EFR46374.1 preprotein translocase, SecA subunit [Helicobacter cinaedi CCUG 18818 = ATCC BAA-847]QOQ90042.1 preprotein translocase subunit SecA [Helicobacter cinaedi]QOQ96224.1 preprotein translocase subunit SecA [Helicobacter cinaedi]BAM11831.1 preprotein translocase subunit SecA [Helicobacter cinaedi PAGU611]